MALSDHELRALREIEQSLLADDPSFGSTVSGDDWDDRPRGQVHLRGIAVVVIGLLLMVGGVVASQASLWFVVVGALGFFVMMAGGIWMLRSGASDSFDMADRRQRAGVSGSGSSFADRLDEKFRHRFDDELD